MEKNTRGGRETQDTNTRHKTHGRAHATELPGVCHAQCDAIPGLWILSARAGGAGQLARGVHRRGGLRACLKYLLNIPVCILTFLMDQGGHGHDTDSKSARFELHVVITRKFHLEEMYNFHYICIWLFACY